MEIFEPRKIVVIDELETVVISDTEKLITHRTIRRGFTAKQAAGLVKEYVRKCQQLMEYENKPESKGNNEIIAALIKEIRGMQNDFAEWEKDEV